MRHGNFKKCIAGLLSVVSIFSAAGCSTGNSQSKGTIAVIVKSQGVDYWDVLKLGADEAAAETGYDIYYDAPPTEADLNVQEDLIKKVVDMNVKAIVIAPLDAESLNDELALASDAGIPVICVDSDCNFADKKVFIASNNTNAGSIEARQAGDILLKNNGGTVAIVGHSQASGNIKGRVGGFVDTLVNTYGADVSALTEDVYISANDISLSDAVKLGQKVRDDNNYPEIKIVSMQYTDLREDAAKVAEKLIDTYSDLSMIYASNQTSNLGVLDGVKNKGKTGKITVMGFDSGDEQIQAITAGEMEGLIAQGPYNMGYLGVRYAHKCINNEKIPLLIDTGVTYVNIDNLNDEEVQLLLNPTAFEDNTKQAAQSTTEQIVAEPNTNA